MLNLTELDTVHSILNIYIHRFNDSIVNNVTRKLKIFPHHIYGLLI